MPATDYKEAPASNRKAKYQRAVSRLSDLPTIPSTLLRIWRLVDSPDFSASDLGKVIAMDQALSAKIMRLVNSPYYGLRGKILSAERAITLLGFETIKSLSVCISVVTALAPEKGKKSNLEMSALWRHSISTGIISKFLAKQRKGAEADAAFSGGVLHDLGKFVMNLTISDKYAEVVELAEREKMFIRDAEEEVLGADHTHFGLLLSNNWAFPGPLREAIANHHDADVKDSNDVVGIVSVANNLANVLDVHASGNCRETERDIESLSKFGVSEDQTEDFLSRMQEQISQAQEFMNLI